MKETTVLKGNIIYMTSIEEMKVVEHGYLVYSDGICEGVYNQLPQELQNNKVVDYGEKLIIPGMVDLHLHAPQYAFRGLGMDKELLDWLNENAFPEERKYENLEYARKAYQIFADDLKKSATTRACIFATMHKDATWELMQLLEATGMITMVGKVNMDRNSQPYLQEKSASQSADDTEWVIKNAKNGLKRTIPIITPRFVPTCTDELMTKLGQLQQEYHLPVQSHLSENYSEIEWVHELNPKAAFYGDAYDMFGLFGTNGKTVMAHCVHSTEEEIQRIKKNGVFVAHCPCSNTSLASGIAPIRKYIDNGLNIGLGTDIAGGFSLSMLRTIAETVNVSKLYWRLIDETKKPVSSKEAFYLATMGGGAFFGKVGSFLPGYEADILVIDDGEYRHPQDISLEQRLERIFYLATDDVIKSKYVKGTKIL